MIAARKGVRKANSVPHAKSPFQRVPFDTAWVKENAAHHFPLFPKLIVGIDESAVRLQVHRADCPKKARWVIHQLEAYSIRVATMAFQQIADCVTNMEISRTVPVHKPDVCTARFTWSQKSVVVMLCWLGASHNMEPTSHMRLDVCDNTLLSCILMTCKQNPGMVLHL